VFPSSQDFSIRKRHPSLKVLTTLPYFSPSRYTVPWKVATSSFLLLSFFLLHHLRPPTSSHLHLFTAPIPTPSTSSLLHLRPVSPSHVARVSPPGAPYTARVSREDHFLDPATCSTSIIARVTSTCTHTHTLQPASALAPATHTSSKHFCKALLAPFSQTHFYYTDL
jgi:hypothetical protein